MPELARHAIDVANLKNGTTPFYQKLENLNDHINIFKHNFYAKTPKYEQTYLEKLKKNII